MSTLIPRMSTTYGERKHSEHVHHDNSDRSDREQSDHVDRHPYAQCNSDRSYHMIAIVPLLPLQRRLAELRFVVFFGLGLHQIHLRLNSPMCSASTRSA